jgi:hypothetical protein
VVNFKSQPLYTREEPPVIIGYEVGWPPEPFRTLQRREELFAFAGNRTTVAHPVAIQSELSQKQNVQDFILGIYTNV